MNPSGLPLWYARSRPVYTEGNRARLLRGGQALFPAMVDAIDAARDEVWLATYIFELDAAGEAVAQALVNAAGRGVRVRVVVDGFGSRPSIAALRERLVGAGVAFVVYRPLERWWAWFRRGHLRRLHLKLCAVDGQVGFAGGINILDDHHDLNHGTLEAPRLDYAVAVTGPVLQPLEQTIRALWTRATVGADWRDELMALLRRRHTWTRTRALLRRMSLRGRAAGVGPAIQAIPGITAAPMLSGAVDESALLRLPHAVRAAFVLRDNLRQRRSIERVFVEAFGRASTRIDLVCPYFYPGRRLRRVLHEATARGVRVRLLLQGRPDYRIAAMAAQALYDELLRRGVEIHEYTAAFLHAKVALVDGRWATVGSANIDPLSLLVNYEANVLIEDEAFAAELHEDLDLAFSGARRVTAPPALPGWRRWLQRAVVGTVARLYLRLAGFAGRY